MEQCIARLDVAMFNAILRESDDEIPTDPMSDPITDPKVLPVPSGKFSFGAGVQLKNAVSEIKSMLITRSCYSSNGAYLFYLAFDQKL
jgi:hypothetical protein